MALRDHPCPGRCAVSDPKTILALTSEILDVLNDSGTQATKVRRVLDICWDARKRARAHAAGGNSQGAATREYAILVRGPDGQLYELGTLIVDPECGSPREDLRTLADALRSIADELGQKPGMSAIVTGTYTGGSNGREA